MVTRCTCGTCCAQGNEFYRSGDYQQALTFYTRAVEADADNAKLYGNRAAALMMLNRYPEVIADCKRVWLHFDGGGGFPSCISSPQISGMGIFFSYSLNSAGNMPCYIKLYSIELSFIN